MYGIRIEYGNGGMYNMLVIMYEVFCKFVFSI